MTALTLDVAGRNVNISVFPVVLTLLVVFLAGLLFLFIVVTGVSIVLRGVFCFVVASVVVPMILGFFF